MWDWLFDPLGTDGFVPRWRCGVWPESLGWTHIVADALIFAAYIAIPVVLASFLLRRRDTPFPRILLLFSAFVLSCGIVHFVEVAIFWAPVYRLSALLKVATAVISVATAAALVPTMRSALKLPGFHETTAQLAAIVATSHDAIISKDLRGIIQSWNKGAERMYGHTADEAVGQHIDLIVPAEKRDELDAFTAGLRRGEPIDSFETVRVHKAGRRLAVALSIAPVFDRRGKLTGYSAIARDLTETRRTALALEKATEKLERANAQLQALADHDPLTGLLNRRGFEAVLRAEADRVRRYGSRAAVILVDCDDFKAINTKLGHDGGDAALRQIGQRILRACRAADQVARIGGDEFMVLAGDSRVSEAARLAERICAAVDAEPIRTAGGNVRVRVSCGVEAVDDHRRHLESLLQSTSSALAESKSSGKNTVRIARRGVPAHLPLDRDLRAVAQPIVDVATGAVRGHELLVRGPLGPLESPAALFEACGAGEAADAFDLSCLRACLAATEAMPGAPGLIHVNVLPSTLLHGGVDEIARELERRSGATFCLEIDEARIIGDPADLARAARALRERTRARICVDNAGFGRSSLEALVVIEPDMIKLDRRMVADAGAVGARRRLERLVRLCRSIDAEIIAAGIEREDQRALVDGAGIALAQGYLWGRPEPVDRRN